MRRARARFGAIGVILASLLLVGVALAQLAFPPLTGRVVDQADILDAPAESRLDAKLAGLETRTTIQLVIVTLRTLQGRDIADYGYQLGRHWGIGQKGKDNGALLIVAPTERRARVEVGYGLEGTLTDAISRLIIENALLPRFRAGDFAGGIERGVDDLIQVLSGDAAEYRERATRRSGPAGQQGLGPFAIVLIILAVWLLLQMSSTPRGRFRGRRQPPFIFLPPMGGGWSGGGGGRSGGGFSGGGGSFGGGGSSGSW